VQCRHVDRPVLGLRRQTKRAMSIKGIHDAFSEVIVVHAEATTNGHAIGFSLRLACPALRVMTRRIGKGKARGDIQLVHIPQPRLAIGAPRRPKRDWRSIGLSLEASAPRGCRTIARRLLSG